MHKLSPTVWGAEVGSNTLCTPNRNRLCRGGWDYLLLSSIPTIWTFAKLTTQMLLLHRGGWHYLLMSSNSCTLNRQFRLSHSAWGRSSIAFHLQCMILSSGHLQYTQIHHSIISSPIRPKSVLRDSCTSLKHGVPEPSSRHHLLQMTLHNDTPFRAAWTLNTTWKSVHTVIIDFHSAIILLKFGLEPRHQIYRYCKAQNSSNTYYGISNDRSKSCVHIPQVPRYMNQSPIHSSLIKPCIADFNALQWMCYPFNALLMNVLLSLHIHTSEPNWHWTHKLNGYSPGWWHID
jgi:hypothetical protein